MITIVFLPGYHAQTCGTQMSHPRRSAIEILKVLLSSNVPKHLDGRTVNQPLDSGTFAALYRGFSMSVDNDKDSIRLSMTTPIDL